MARWLDGSTANFEDRTKQRKEIRHARNLALKRAQVVTASFAIAGCGGERCNDPESCSPTCTFERAMWLDARKVTGELARRLVVRDDSREQMTEVDESTIARLGPIGDELGEAAFLAANDEAVKEHTRALGLLHWWAHRMRVRFKHEGRLIDRDTFNR